MGISGASSSSRNLARGPRVSETQSAGFFTLRGGFCALRGPLPVSGDALGCHGQAVRGCGHLLARSQGCC